MTPALVSNGCSQLLEVVLSAEMRKQRHVPLHDNFKFRIMPSFRAAQAAVGHMKIDLFAAYQQAEHGRGYCTACDAMAKTRSRRSVMRKP
jgi:hypothetical protein